MPFVVSHCDVFGWAAQLAFVVHFGTHVCVPVLHTVLVAQSPSPRHATQVFEGLSQRVRPTRPAQLASSVHWTQVWDVVLHAGSC